MIRKAQGRRVTSNHRSINRSKLQNVCLELAGVDERVGSCVEFVVDGEQSLFFLVLVHLSVDVVEYVARQRQALRQHYLVRAVIYTDSMHTCRSLLPGQV